MLKWKQKGVSIAKEECNWPMRISQMDECVCMVETMATNQTNRFTWMVITKRKTERSKWKFRLFAKISGSFAMYGSECTVSIKNE